MEDKEKVSIHQLFWYFIIFSIIGLFIETMYCYITTGVLESRKGLIWGPFCPVYGVGASLLILLLNRFKNNKIKLIIYGGIVGDVIEYLMSYGLEAIYSTRFWDYSYTNFHLNGRICLIYTVFWAILSVLLISFVKPIIDKCMEKINFKYINIIEILITIFLVIDVLCTVWGISLYEQKAIAVYYNKELNKKNTFLEKVESILFSDEKMLRTFPNIRFINENNEEIWIKDVINNKFPR
ncbi:MAG: putative ABC transporter permease [Clostridia bacterium]|nr:putative ABC transporter permease [Clostridia bacterium]